MMQDDGIIAFPDSVTERGQKHLQTLMEVVASGKRAVLVFCVQHSGATAARPADEIDVRYGQLLREAIEKGVEVLAWKVGLSAHGFQLEHPLPIRL